MVIDSGFEVINTGLGANYTSVTLVTGFSRNRVYYSELEGLRN